MSAAVVGVDVPKWQDEAGAASRSMKAATYTRYGPPDVVQITDVEKPSPRDNEVLIKVRAASVNPLDWHFMRGTPYLVRIIAGLRHPKDHRLGVDVAGQVEAVGKNVTRFKPGDAVFGGCRGAFAEYACASESGIAIKPDNMTYEQAASVPVAAFTALQGLRDRGHMQSGQKVLINGAAGGVGTLAVQIAKSFGTEVTGVCSTRNVEMIRAIGADRVIDYTQEDFTQGGRQYDLILDLMANHPLSAYRRILQDKGICVTAGGSVGRWMIRSIVRSTLALSLSRLTSQTFVGCFAKSNQADLTVIQNLMTAGRVTPVIDRRYSLSEVPAAIRYLEEGHARGKVVVTMANS
jgi:NADPH:quinone reductase-like Zn-dependent oxidoreductase